MTEAYHLGDMLLIMTINAVRDTTESANRQHSVIHFTLKRLRGLIGRIVCAFSINGRAQSSLRHIKACFVA